MSQDRTRPIRRRTTSGRLQHRSDHIEAPPRPVEGGKGPTEPVERPDGYSPTTKLLHWLTVVVLALQFLMGYAMDRFDDLLDGTVVRWLGGEDDYLLVVHAGIGVVLLVLAVFRVLWRTRSTLPPWAEGLSERERRVAHTVERLFYWLLFLIPLSGLALLFLSGEDWDLGDREWISPVEIVDDDILLVTHIGTHVLFFGALLTHVDMVLKHQFVDRDRLLQRML
ncbi:MAG: hypothetical protein GEU79_17900 [Acidimicrobiia bacterium]|nr:hypothetical protein [Acidimicrobiia bacterium]